MTSFAVNIDNDSNDRRGLRRPQTFAGAEREKAFRKTLLINKYWRAFANKNFLQSTVVYKSTQNNFDTVGWAT